MAKAIHIAGAAPAIEKQYEAIEKIGVGARSTVYKVRRREDGKILALKHVAKMLPEDQRYLRHLRNEYEMLCRIQDGPGPVNSQPNIVTVYELFKARKLLKVSSLSMLMEYIPGSSLSERPNRKMRQIIDVFAQVCTALERMHERGILHGDMKPENILVMHNGWAKIIDFGFSCPVRTQLGNLKGTRDFIAPEQVSGGVVTEQTDIYNLGASFYKVITGTPVPAVMPNLHTQSAIFLTGDTIRATPPSEENPDCPEWLSDIIMCCIEKKPQRRPSSVREILKEVETEQLRMKLADTDK